MNARTSRLLRRVALAGLKKAWNRTPRPQRGALRPALVQSFHTLMGGAHA